MPKAQSVTSAGSTRVSRHTLAVTARHQGHADRPATDGHRQERPDAPRELPGRGVRRHEADQPEDPERGRRDPQRRPRDSLHRRDEDQRACLDGQLREALQGHPHLLGGELVVLERAGEVALVRSQVEVAVAAQVEQDDGAGPLPPSPAGRASITTEIAWVGSGAGRMPSARANGHPPRTSGAGGPPVPRSRPAP